MLSVGLAQFARFAVAAGWFRPGGRPRPVHPTVRAHQCLADEDASAPQARARSASSAAASRLPILTIWSGSAGLVLGDRQVGLEALQVAVVDADDAGIELQGLFQFLWFMDLEQGVESGESCSIVECADRVVGQGAHDNEDAAGTGLGSFEHLDGVDHEIFSQAGGVALVFVEEVDDLPQVLEAAAEVVGVGQHREAVGFRIGVLAGLFDRIKVSGSDGCGGRLPDFGNHGQTVGACERRKSCRPGAGCQPDIRARRSRTGGSGFEGHAVWRHDFGEFVHVSKKESPPAPVGG